MSAILTFWHKEWLAAWRNYHILILAVIFVIFGIEAPLMAKLMPDLMKLALGDQFSIKLPQSTSSDSWQQFYKNTSQIGIFLLALVFSGTVSQEVSSGTLVNLITKGLPRYAVIIAKYLAAVVQWVVAIGVSFIITWGYTAYYFPDDKSPHVWLAIWPVLLFGLFFVAVVLLGSTVVNSNYAGFLVAALVFASLALLNYVKAVKRWNPIALVTDNLDLVRGTEKITHILPACGVTVAAALVILGVTIWTFNQKRL
ncbi:ABC transporter permease [Levilactobacillus fujinensis]|uniref:ABC transporter permease n=1 Tax=Levilactobacillus fujinensis TaxID=2486024 RepID=A0ABW1TK70_9LACO|nr:ABC transporter permease subunit [Levilactobacillus fujinensis]